MPLSKTSSSGSLRVVPSSENLSKIYSKDGSVPRVLSKTSLSTQYWSEEAAHTKSRQDKVWEWSEDNPRNAKIVEYHVPKGSLMDGTVEASNDEPIVPGLPSEAELAARVQTAPSLLDGKLLVENGFSPNMQVHKVVKLFLEHHHHTHEGGRQRGHFDLCTMETHEQEVRAHENDVNEQHPILHHEHTISGKAHLEEHNALLPSNHHRPGTLVLYDGDSKAAAVVRQTRKPGQTWHGIYASRKLHAHDRKMICESGVEFYPWLQVHVEQQPSNDSDDNDNLPVIDVRVWNGSDHVPFWSVKTILPPSVAADNAEADSKPRRDSYLLQDAKSSSSMMGYLVHETHPETDTDGWAVTIAPGVDPAIPLTVAAALENALYAVPSPHNNNKNPNSSEAAPEF